VKLVPAAVILALVAVRMTDRFRTLAAWAVGLSILWWLLGMTVAVITDNPLY
jgi:ABC-type Mn2+/Zn2+ transport system permease subunit